MDSATNLYPFDRSSGNGSRSAEEDWIDQNTTAAENQWSTAETTFYYWEAPAHRQEKLESLYDTHHGRGESDRKTTIRRSRIVSDAETFTNILEFPEPERSRVINIAEEMDFSSKRFGGKSYEKVLLAICSLVSDRALSDYIENGETSSKQISDRIVLRDSFKNLMEVNDMSSREHNRIRQMIREKTEYF